MLSQLFEMVPSEVISCEAEVVKDREYEPITCPLDANHKRAWRLPGPVTIDPIESDTADCLWTPLSDCLVSDVLIHELRTNNVAGFETEEVNLTRASPVGRTYSQLVVRGWGGVADKSSGIELVNYCKGCHYMKYSALCDPNRLFDSTAWDGSDVFMIWPLPKFIFVTKKVVDLFSRLKVKGAAFIPIGSINAGGNGFCPGRLSHHFPNHVALRIGKPLGID
jgi:hypothetical protein